MGVDHTGSIRLTDGAAGPRPVDADGADDRAGRAGHAAAVRLPHLGPAVRADHRQPARPDGEAVREALGAVGAARRGRRGRRRSPTTTTTALVRINDRLPGAGDQRPPQPGVSRSTSSRTREELTMPLPAPESRRPHVPGHRRRGQAADPALLPGVDEPQPVRPRRRAHRAVRVDERDGAVPASTRCPNGSTCTS